MPQTTESGPAKNAVVPGLSGASRSRTNRDNVAWKAERRLQASRYAALRSIRCEFHDGVLVLHGRVASFYLKQLAQELVRHLDGVDVIANAVEVTD